MFCETIKRQMSKHRKQTDRHTDKFEMGEEKCFAKGRINDDFLTNAKIMQTIKSF